VERNEHAPSLDRDRVSSAFQGEHTGWDSPRPAGSRQPILDQPTTAGREARPRIESVQGDGHKKINSYVQNPLIIHRLSLLSTNWRRCSNVLAGFLPKAPVVGFKKTRSPPQRRK